MLPLHENGDLIAPARNVNYGFTGGCCSLVHVESDPYILVLCVLHIACVRMDPCLWASSTFEVHICSFFNLYLFRFCSCAIFHRQNLYYSLCLWKLSVHIPVQSIPELNWRFSTAKKHEQCYSFISSSPIFSAHKFTSLPFWPPSRPKQWFYMINHNSVLGYIVH